MKKIEKEVVYTVPYEKEKDITKAEQLRATLYEKYNIVEVYPQGLHTVKIVCKEKIKGEKQKGEMCVHCRAMQRVSPQKCFRHK